MEKVIWNEEWKPLIIEGMVSNKKYEISNYGRIRSYKADDSKRLEYRYLKGTEIKKYKVIMFRNAKGNNITKYIHKMVAEHFLPRQNEEQTHVLHINYDKSNNYIKNLRWATPDEVGSHQKENPRHKRGRITNSKLTETKVKLIKRTLERNKDGKMRLKMIAKRFGITHTQLNRIRSGENWGNISAD